MVFNRWGGCQNTGGRLGRWLDSGPRDLRPKGFGVVKTHGIRRLMGGARCISMMLRRPSFRGWVMLLRLRGFNVLTGLINVAGQRIGQSSEGATEQALVRRGGEAVGPVC